MPELYRLSWEMVPVGNRRHQLIALQTPADRVPDEDWVEVTREGLEADGVVAQAQTLAGWETEGREYVRRVRLERLASLPVWEEVPIP